MLHQVKLPSYEPILNDFLQFQRKLLEVAFTYAITSFPLSSADINAIADNFNKPLRPWLRKKLAHKKSLLGGELLIFSNHMCSLPDEQVRIAQKNKILAIFDHDIHFNEHIDDKFTFDYETIQKDEPLCTHLSSLMHVCYQSLLEDGFPFPTSSNEILFTRALLTEWFWDENEDSLHVCPYCDGPAPERKKTERVRQVQTEHTQYKTAAEIDHFFNKAYFPFIIAHPHNLIPCCKTCNSSLNKGTHNPIKDQTLQDTFLPFQRSGIQDVQIVFTKIRYKETDLRIVPAPHADVSLTTKRIDNLIRVLDLKKRWEGSTLDRFWEDVAFEIQDKLKETRQYLSFYAEQIDRMYVQEYIQANLTERQKRLQKRLRKEAFAFLKISSITHKLSNQAELDLLIDFVLDPTLPKVG